LLANSMPSLQEAGAGSSGAGSASGVAPPFSRLTRGGKPTFIRFGKRSSGWQQSASAKSN
uniref:AP2 domain-containing protein n=1 Tax=Anisakis simplex TaxID=6269 RepID=A0A0M3KJ57_ANISI